MSRPRGLRLALVSLLAGLATVAVLPAPASATPTCAEGPQRVGATIYGTPCADTIHVPQGVTTVYGEAGADTTYGGRGNQTIYGGEGNDRLYGGVGDDHLRGGPGDDLLSGGFGADSLDGEEGSDYVRGDATIDYLGDTGASGVDTLSFATGATPGFPNAGNLGYQGFPQSANGRGVLIDLSERFANDGLAPAGGGVDEPLPAEPPTGSENFEGFEVVVGTPFSDFIVGGSNTQAIYGGGGADVMLGDAATHIYGGAGGDYCDGGEAQSSCEFTGAEKKVEPGDPSMVDVGAVVAGGGAPDIYLDGSEGADRASATYSGSSASVTFKLSGSSASFDAAEAAAGGCTATAAEAVCPAAEAPDSVVLAGLGGEDSFSASEFPDTTSIVELGGDGADQLHGTEAEDVLVDGSGDDTVKTGGGDDALPNNQGEDRLYAEAGNDLFISNAVCEGDLLDGGEGRDNANWANFKQPVSLDLASGRAGLLGDGGLPECGSGSPTSLRNLEDIEATDYGDTLIGDAGENQLLGRRGSDSYYAGPGNDTILANSGTPTPDPDPVIDCGEGFDTAEIDYPENGPDAAPSECEAVEQRAPNSFRPPDTPPGPEPEPPASLPPATPPPPIAPPLEPAPPRTRLLHHPDAVVYSRGRRRAVSFAFASNEPGASFRCRLDRRPFSPCRSPRRYRVGLGRHVVRIYAEDATGEADRSPAVFHFRVRRLSVHSSRSHRRRGQTR